MKRITRIISAIGASWLVYKALDTRIHTRDYSLVSEKVTEPIRLAYLSDLHNNQFGLNQQTLKDLVSSAKPDAVLLGGDIYDYMGNPENTTTLLRWLGGCYPTYYVTGNHEDRMSDIASYKVLIRQMGIHVLEGESLTLTVGSSQLKIHGVDDARNKAVFLDQLHRVGHTLNTEQFNLLLSHHPECIREYEAYPFDLILSGHAHGGQWRLPGLVNGFYAPQQGVFPEYAGGQYDLANAARLIVSRGLMVQGQRFPRVFNPPEMVVVDIVPNEDRD